MSRLIEAARYSNTPYSLHEVRAARQTHQGCEEPIDDWARAAEHVRRIDPKGKETTLILWEMELSRKRAISTLYPSQDTINTNPTRPD